jgi:hypothetical protein
MFWVAAYFSCKHNGNIFFQGTNSKSKKYVVYRLPVVSVKTKINLQKRSNINIKKMLSVQFIQNVSAQRTK